MRKTLKTLKLTIGGSAPKALDISPRTSKHYAAKDGDVPGPVERLLDMFKRHGVPEEWR